MSQGYIEEVPLFACTKCNSRHPFEDLSQGHQLCKDCKGSYQVVKCNYCRSEFQQETGSKSKSICKKCDQLQAQHGKPGPCAYCNIIAAFIGTKCQRCTNSEKKYGPPMSCEHCRQKCAFDRKDPESKKKVDGKLLCWLCTMAYKRTIAKAKQKEAILKSSYSSGSHRHGGGDNKSSYSSRNQMSTSNGSNRSSNPNGAASNPSSASTSSALNRSSSNRHSHNQNASQSHHKDQSSTSSSSANKKSRLETTSHPPNGHLSTNLGSMTTLTETRFIDPNNSEMGNLITQLKDQVSLLNKRIQQKDKELLSKDQQIADLKSVNTREQRELREKITTLQKQHTEKISEMQSKLVAMQRQLSSQNKSTKSNPATGFVQPPLVI